MNQSLPEQTIVLLGIGHTNAHIVRKWSMSPIPSARLVCVSNFPVSTYSGMLPGVLAGNYRPEQMQIDLVRLCAAAGAELILDDVVGLDADEQRLLFDARPSLRFDALSIGIGSVPRIDATLSADAPVVAIKPMQTFLERLTTRVRSVTSTLAAQSTPAAPSSRGASFDGGNRRPITIAVVGGGAGGVEICLCLPGFLRSASESESNEALRDSRILLIQRDEQLLPGVSTRLRQRVQQELSSRGVDVLGGRTVVQVDGARIILDDQAECHADVILWATGAAAPPLLGQLGLPLDDDGFLLTDETLKTTADLPIFAVGDSGTLEDERVPKAGVYAVRQGPVLWDNLVRITEGRPLATFRPQRRFLKLLNRGDGKAFGEYHGISFGGAWTWRLKDWIDTRFMEKYQGLRPMEMNGADETPMRCHGCGSKLSSSSLFDVLETIGRRESGNAAEDGSQNVSVGLSDADDAAVIRLGDSQQIVLTTDFFPAPLDDAYLSGRIAALHAMSDVFAMGAQPTAAMALATLPRGSSRAQQELLSQLMLGCLHEFDKTGTSLVGGHTTEGPETTIGFSVVGEPWGDELCRKGSFLKSSKEGWPGLDRREGPDASLAESLHGDARHAGPSAAPPTENQPPIENQRSRTKRRAGDEPTRRLEPGDRLVLTKPLGTGVLLAAHRQARCDADSFTSLLEMLLSGVEADARCAWELGARWMTDVSGFGLAGHLIELLRGHSVCAELDLTAVPVLPGSVELSSAGIASSLFPANHDAAIGAMEVPAHLAEGPLLPLLFDPQTCGGLLIVLSESMADEFLKRSSGSARDVGRITTAESSARVQVVASSRTG